MAGDFAAALSVARQQVENGAQMIDVNMDEAMLDSKAAMVKFLNLVAAEPDISRVPVDDRFVEVGRDRGGAEVRAGQVRRQLDQHERRQGRSSCEHAKLAKRYGAAVIVMAFDEKGQADTLERKIEICASRVSHPRRRSAFPGRRHHLRPEHLRDRDRHRRAQQLRRRFHRGDALDPREPAARAGERRAFEHLVLVPRQQPGARGDPHRVPVSRDQSRAHDGDRQRRPDRRLRRDPERPARARRRHHFQPPARRGRAHGHFRRRR